MTNGESKGSSKFRDATSALITTLGFARREGRGRQTKIAIAKERARFAFKDATRSGGHAANNMKQLEIVETAHCF